MTGALGRPRSEIVRRAILDTTVRLTMRDGYQALTIKGVAQEAGVGRQTIYRWWPAKGALVLEAIGELAERAARPAPTGDAVRDLRALLRASFRLVPAAGSAISGMMAEAQHDPEFAQVLQQGLLAPRRALVREILARGQRDGQLGHETDLDLAVDLVWGTMWYRTLSGHAPVDEHLAEELADVVVKLLADPGVRAEPGSAAGP
ncbi:TetR/AcrR family transcriptional regulator [Actinocrinis puniceicyclus]|uniref:TetR/AcrR family transcriptional regulator n=1 Tax=Actinocrinis puniceicyclus TaxID=977794 RepID=A0A8J8B988_9ACTN|nr:TetR/AcrR family transcriptional regulator [Actinocrinis puniceicyclus]MBS2961582.1 TetR/AcrR family transcriptional regulator [Actinocrinis puniceicyclus]